LPVQFHKQCHNCKDWFGKDQFNSQVVEVGGVRKRVFGCFCLACLQERPELLPYQFPSDDELTLAAPTPPA